MTNRVAFVILVLAVGGYADMMVEEAVTAFSADEGVELLQLRGANEIQEESLAVEEEDEAETRWKDEALPKHGHYEALSTTCLDKQHLAGTSRKAQSIEACEKDCAGNPGCVGFDFYAAKSMCFLKSNCEGTPGKCTQSQKNSCGYKYTAKLGPYWETQMNKGHVSVADQSQLRCWRRAGGGVWLYKGKNTGVGCGFWSEKCAGGNSFIHYCAGAAEGSSAGKANFGYGADQAKAVKKAIDNGGTYSLLDETQLEESLAVEEEDEAETEA